MADQSISFELPATDNLRGAVWMTGYSLCFGSASVAVKAIGDLPAAEIGFLRCLIGMTLLIPAFAKYGFGIYRSTNPRLHIIRVMSTSVSVLASYYAIAHLPLATAVSLNFTRPLFMIVIALLFLGEHVRWRRGLATLVGFAGVVVMLGPSHVGFTVPAFTALLSAACAAGGMAVIRQQAAVDGALPLFAWFATGITVLLFFPAMIGWQQPAPQQWLLLVFVGLATSTGQYCLIRALAQADATVVNPIDYGQIILAVLFGYFAFGEVPNPWSGVGAAVIVASTLYILLREARVKTECDPAKAPVQAH